MKSVTKAKAKRPPVCRFCRREIETKATGRPPRVCQRKKCQRANWLERQQRRRERIRAGDDAMPPVARQLVDGGVSRKLLRQADG